jgi:hypothetical protein
VKANNEKIYRGVFLSPMFSFKYFFGDPVGLKKYIDSMNKKRCSNSQYFAIYGHTIGACEKPILIAIQYSLEYNSPIVPYNTIYGTIVLFNNIFFYEPA